VLTSPFPAALTDVGKVASALPTDVGQFLNAMAQDDIYGRYNERRVPRRSGDVDRIRQPARQLAIPRPKARVAKEDVSIVARAALRSAWTDWVGDAGQFAMYG
jgi:hypothetical protein